MAEGQPRGEPERHSRALIAALAAALAVGGVLVSVPEWTWWHLAGALLVGGAGGWLAAHDAATHKLPNRVTYPLAGALAVLVGASALAGVPGAGRALAWGAGLGAAFLLLALLAGGGLGLGDVKLSVILGAWAGWLAPTAPIILVIAAFLLGGITALVLMALGRAGRASRIAFGPFLVAGTLIATWWPGA